MSWKNILKEYGIPSEHRRKVPYVKDGFPHCCRKPMEMIHNEDGTAFHRCIVCGGEI